MGVRIRIGNKVPIPEELRDEDPDQIWVDPIRLESNKELPIPTGIKNEWNASYVGFHHLACSLGLENFFYEDGDFKGGHSGGFIIEEKVLAEIDLALDNAKKENPDYVMRNIVVYDDDIIKMDFIHWLHYWSHHAFNNFPNPFIYNS